MIAPVPAVVADLSEFFERTYRPARLVGRSEASAVQYRVALRQFGEYLGREPTVRDLTDAHVAGFQASYLARGRSPATANKYGRHLLALWRLAKRRKLLVEDPDVERIPEPKRVPVAWLEEEMERIVTAAAARRGNVAGVPARRWWPALILVLYDTGLRISAAMSLQWDWYDGGSLLVPAEVQKHNSDQRFRLSDQAVAALASIEEPARAEIFIWPWDRGQQSWPTLNRHYREILKAAGLPSTRKHMFHMLRRTCASWVKRGGGDATAYLGHSSSQVTRAYLDPRIVSTQREADLLPRLNYAAAETVRPRFWRFS